MHARLAQLSSNSRHAVVEGSGDEIHLFEPSAVITASGDLLRSIRKRKRMTQEQLAAESGIHRVTI